MTGLNFGFMDIEFIFPQKNKKNFRFQHLLYG